MAIDTTLVRGAYQANKPQGVIGVKEITDIGDSIVGGINNYMASVKAKHTVRNAEYDAFAESVLDNSDLTGEQYEALYDQLALGKEDFANSDKKTRSLRLRELQAMAGDYADYKALREDIAINKNDLSPAFTNSPEGKMYLDILKGDGKKLMKKDGRIGIKVDGEWKSISSIKQSLDDNKIDKTSSEMLEAFRINAQTSEDEFNYDETKRNIMNSMVSKGKYKSLINDEIIPGRVFRADLAESLMNKKYSDLGITDEDFEGIEGVNSDGIIDAVEAENIIRHLEADKNEMNEVLTNYYTSYIQNNGKSKEQVATSSTGLTTNEQEMLNMEGTEDDPEVENQNANTETQTASQDVVGGNISDDGIYIPQAETPTYSPDLSRSQVFAVKSLSIQSTPNGGANILENGKAITMDIEGGIATVDAVRADGNSIVVDTSGFMAPGKNAPFGKFTKQGGGYKWEPDMAMQKKFAKYASNEQKTAMMTFINLMETDPQYAEALISHISKDEGTINAATLK